ncbi:MAG: dihydrofolate reductase [Collinsella sp.]|nr:dihydrofolate reductase [Collinsella sp.]
MANLKAIVAVCDDWGIGCDGDMVIENRADMRHFVRETRGGTVVMGRKTLASLPGGLPLKGRRNIVITRDASFNPGGVEVVHGIDELLAAVEAEEVAWVIGGGEVYRQLLPFCTEALITKNHAVRPVDTSFPNLDEDSAWELAEESEVFEIQPGEGDAGLAYRFCVYRRRAEDAGAGEPAPAAAAADGARETAAGAAERPAAHPIKTMILYRSKHHGNTKKLVDAIAAAFPDEVDTLDVAALGRNEYPDLSEYRLIGAASGIYYGGFDKDLKRVLDHSLSFGDKVFGLMTFGGADKWHGRDLAAVAQVKMASVLTMHGCRGWDTWGPYRLVGGAAKGHPDAADIQGAVDFFARLREDYGEILEDEWQKRRRRQEFERAHPAGGLMANIKRTVRRIAGSNGRAS